MMRRILCLLLLSLLCGCASGASTAPQATLALPQAMTVNAPAGSDLLSANSLAGDALAAILLQHTGSGSPIVTTSFVSVDNVDATSTFGRMTGQQVASRLGQHGFRMLETKLGADLRVDASGEYMLTRDCSRLLAQEYDAYAALVGVYAAGADKVFVSARVVRLADSAIVAAYEYFVPLSDALGLVPGAAGSNTTGGDSFWRRYAVRGRTGIGTSALTLHSVAVPAAKNPVTVWVPAGTAAEPAALPPGVRLIDPTAAPTPFPGRRK